MSVQYIVLDPATMAEVLPWSAVAKETTNDYEAVGSPFSGDGSILELINTITEPYPTLFAELADFEPCVPLQTDLPTDQVVSPQVLTPPASPPTHFENSDQLIAFANELLDLRKSPIEFDSLFKSVEAEVQNWEYEALSPNVASPGSSDITDYDVMSPDGLYGSITSDSCYEENGSYLTLDPNYASLLSEPSSADEISFDEHSYSRPSVQSSIPAPTRKDTRKVKIEAKKPRSKYSAEDRKQRKKEQNKQAAIRYRQKKREELLRFMSYEKELLQVNRSLSREANNIRTEIRIVKKLMRDHFTAKGLL